MSYHLRFLNLAAIFVMAILLLVPAGYVWNHDHLLAGCIAAPSILCMLSVMFFGSGLLELDRLEQKLLLANLIPAPSKPHKRF